MKREGNWKPVIGFENLYVVSDHGAILPANDGRIFDSSTDSTVTLVKKGLSGRYSRLDVMVSSWLGERPIGHVLLLNLSKAFINLNVVTYEGGPGEYVRIRSFSGRIPVDALLYVKPSDPRCPPRDDSLDEYERIGIEPVVRSHGASECYEYDDDYDPYY